MRFDNYKGTEGGMSSRQQWAFVTMVVSALVAFVQPIDAAELSASRITRGLVPPNILVSRLRVSLNKSKIIPIGASFSDVLVGSPEIVDVVPLNDHEIYILGKKLGTTNISVLDFEKNRVGLIDVEVGLDTGDVAEKLFRALGSRSIRVSTRGNKVILSGSAPDAPTVDRAVGIAAELVPEGGGVINTIQVASPQQVLLQVKLVEINRTATREFGLRWEYTNRNAGVGIGHAGPLAPFSTAGSPNAPLGGRGDSGVPLSAIASASLERTGVPPFAQILGRFVGNSQQLDVILSALEEKGLARRLAEPNLVALSGDTASFLAGGEFPIPSGSSGGVAGIPTIQIVFKEFGVRLSFTPTVLANGAINLRLEPEVSEIDPAISVNTGLVNVPGLSKRRARTTVELRDGQSFAIAGLLQSISQTDLEQFPWLGSVPVIGALLRSTSFRHRETELVVIVTPHLVKPARPGAILATPLDTTAPANDVDLFLMGQIERKKLGATRVEQYIPAAGSVSGPHGHILTVPLPVGATTRNPPIVDEPPVRVKN